MSSRDRAPETRMALIGSTQWRELTATLDLMRCADVGPIDLRDWTHEDHDLAVAWTLGETEKIPPLIAEYIARVKG